MQAITSGIDDDDLDILDLAEDGDNCSIEQLYRTKPGALNNLCTQTKFSKHEIRMLYQGFKQECPSGIVTEDAFKAIFARFFPQGDSSRYAHFVFKTFKPASKGRARLNFEQFVIMLSSLSRGSPVEKLRWIFNLYDIQATGYVTRPEMIQIVSSIYDMLGHCTKPKVDDSCAQAHVDTVFNQMDTNQDGVITFDEFCDWCQKDPGRSQNLAMFDTVFL